MVSVMKALRIAFATGALTVLGLAPLTAAASVGTGVGATPITLDVTAVRGHTYTLPRLYVVNTGTETSRYTVRVIRLEQGAQRDVPSGWVTVGGAPLTLAPRATANITLTLDVPADAPTGDYMSDVVAGTVIGSGGGGASLGAQAATQLRFTVGEDGLPWPPPLWADAGILAVVVVAGMTYAVRRSGLRIQVQRRH